MAKKIACRVIKTRPIHSSPSEALFKAWQEYCNSKQGSPIIGFNPFKRIKERAAKPDERRKRSRSFDFYA